MARKLEPDYIKWVLTLNATQAQEEFHKLEKTNKELKKQTDASRKAMADLEAQGKKGSAEWNNLRKSIRANSDEMARNRARMDELSKRFDLNSMSVNQLNKRLRELKREFNNTSRATDPKRFAELQAEINRTQQALNNVRGATESAGGAFRGLAKMKETVKGFFIGIGMAITALVTGAFRDAFNLIVEFEKANAKLAAILGTTREGIAELEAAARKLGATTSYSAAQVTALQIELAKLGFQKQQILDMEGAVLKFAKAVDTDLASAAAFTGAALRIFNKDATETENVLATFAISTTKTALDFSKLQASMATVGPVAAAFGLSVEDTTALLGQLANAGFDASSAATATRNIILNLSDANGKLAKAFGQPVKDAEGLAAALQKLNAQGIDLAKALELTDKRSVSAFASFLKSADSLVSLRDSITDVEDEFNGMSATMGDTVAGAMAGLQSAAQELVLKLTSGTNGFIKEMINGFTSLVQGAGKIVDWLGRFGKEIRLLITAIAAYKAGMFAASLATKGFHALMAAGRIVMTAYRATVTLLRSGFTGLIAQIKAATTAQSTFRAVMAATPWGAIVAAISALVAVYMSLDKEMDDVAKASKKEADEMKRQDEILESHQKARESFIEKLETEKRKIADLVKAASDENEAKETRLLAIKKLNEICPEYNGHLDKEERQLIANTKALDKYIASMEKRMRLAYYKDEYQNYIAEEERAKARLRKAQKQYEAHAFEEYDKEEKYYTEYAGGLVKIPHTKTRHVRAMDDPTNQYTHEYNMAKSDVITTAKATKTFKEDLEEDGITLTEVLSDLEEEVDNVTASIDGGKGKKGLKKAVDENKDTVKSLKDQFSALYKELKRMRKENTEALELNYQKRTAAQTAFYDEQKLQLEKAVLDGRITQEAADIYLLNSQKSHHEAQLKELKDYYENVKGNAAMEETEKQKLLLGLEQEIRGMQSQILTDTGKWSAKMREMTTNTTSPEGIRAYYQEQVEAEASAYDAMIRIAQANGEDTVALEQEKQRRIKALNFGYREEMRKLSDGLTQLWSMQYDSELDALRNMHEQGRISEEQFQSARLGLAMRYGKKQFDYYSQLSGTMFKALEDAEIARSEAKYDVMIQQARNAGQETTAIEEQKENDKLAIQKKYADVNFAIKVSQIIADTAVSIMTAFAQLGPIGGAIAAGMLTATGVAQVALAAAERDKVKNMEPGNTSTSATSSTTPQTERKLTGYADGGYTGDGDRYEVAGLVHRGEYVVPMPIMKNPAVVDAVATIEAIRQHGAPGRARSNGKGLPQYAEGGYVEGMGAGSYSLSVAGSEELIEAVKELKDATRSIRAYVVYSDIEHAQSTMAAARRPFTK